MNYSDCLTFAEVCECCAKSEQIECMKLRQQNKEWKIHTGTLIDMENFVYRKIPVNTMVPWTYDTCPREGFTRMKGGNRLLRINDISIDGVNDVKYVELLEYREYSLNGIDNWIPCGTVEMSK